MIDPCPQSNDKGVKEQKTCHFGHTEIGVLGGGGDLRGGPYVLFCPRL